MTYLGNTNDGVLNNGLEGVYGRSLSVSGVPHLKSNAKALVGTLTSGHLHHSDVDWQVGKVLLDLTSWALNNDMSSLAGDGDYIRYS